MPTENNGLARIALVLFVDGVFFSQVRISQRPNPPALTGNQASDLAVFARGALYLLLLMSEPSFVCKSCVEAVVQHVGGAALLFQAYCCTMMHAFVFHCFVSTQRSLGCHACLKAKAFTLSLRP
jgi:hypothetical protein